MLLHSFDRVQCFEHGYYRQKMSRPYWYHTIFIHSLSRFGIICSFELMHHIIHPGISGISIDIFTVSPIFRVFDIHDMEVS